MLAHLSDESLGSTTEDKYAPNLHSSPKGQELAKEILAAFNAHMQAWREHSLNLCTLPLAQKLVYQQCNPGKECLWSSSIFHELPSKDWM